MKRKAKPLALKHSFTWYAKSWFDQVEKVSSSFTGGSPMERHGAGIRRWRDHQRAFRCLDGITPQAAQNLFIYMKRKAKPLALKHSFTWYAKSWFDQVEKVSSSFTGGSPMERHGGLDSSRERESPPDEQKTEKYTFKEWAKKTAQRRRFLGTLCSGRTW